MPMTDTVLPLQEQLKNWIHQKIQSGELKSGDRIPSINQLTDQFKFSRETVRLSLDSLVTSGVLNPKQGRGFFIAPREKRLLRVGLLGKLDGVYIRPIYEGLHQELNGHASILVMDSHRSEKSMSDLIENLAHHQSVDRLLVIPVRGSESALEAFLAPFRRYFKIAWLDRAPDNTRDSTFVCDYEKCVDLALDHFRQNGFKSIYYFSRNPEDNSVFSTMRRAFGGPITGEWQDLLYKASQSDSPLGILTETDTEAVFLQTRLLANGIKIPDQVSLISCDNSSLTDLVSPAITAVEPGFIELGRQAGKWIKEEKETGQHFTARPILIKKESTL